MRNLKRVLSLALACVMVIGMMVMTTGAADLKDYDEITNVEAVDVMSALGILEGDENGNFNPDGILTREQAAKIICYMLLGANNAEKLGKNTTIFADVAAGRWSAGYIAYCANLGIISGFAGEFDPEGQLTGVAFGKMLLTALGYDAEIEGYVNDINWSTNIATDLFDAGIDGGVSLELPLSRDDAALMALNAIKAPLVKYQNTGSNISVNGAEIVFGASDAEYVTTELANTQTISARQLTNTDDFTIEFAEKYMPALELVTDETDAFGRPSHTWYYQNEEVGSYIDSELLIATYTDSVKGSELYKLLGKKAVDDYTITIYMDGLEQTITEVNEISRNNNDGFTPSGRGVLTEVFMDIAAQEVTITAINTYLAIATADYNTKTEKATFAIYGVDKDGGNFVKTSTPGTEDVETGVKVGGPSVKNIKKDDVVLVNVAGKAVVTVKPIEVVEDVTIDSFSKNVKIAAGGDTYMYAETAEYDYEVLDAWDDNNMKGVTYNVYLDTYGNMIGLDIVNVADNYVFVTGVNPSDGDNLANGDFEVRGIFMDGTTKVFTAREKLWDTDGDTDVDSDDAILTDEIQHNQWYTYTESKGVYTLTWVTDTYAAGVKVAQSVVDDATAVEIDYKHTSLKTADGTMKTVYGNDYSVYMTAKLSGITNVSVKDVAITGVANMTTGVKNTSIQTYAAAADKAAVKPAPADGAELNEAVYVLYKSNGYVMAAVVVGEDSAVSKNLAYISSGDVSLEGYNSSADEWTWTRSAIIDGEEVTLTEVGGSLNYLGKDSTNGDMDMGEWFIVSYNADGNVAGATLINADVLGSIDFVDDYASGAIQTAIDNEDIVLFDSLGTLFVNVAEANLPTLIGQTLYLDNDDENGFFLASDVKIVLIQKNNSSRPVVTIEEGPDAVEAVLESLNAAADGNYDFNLDALIEDGAAKVVVINDTNGGAGYGNKQDTDTSAIISVNISTPATVKATWYDNGGSKTAADFVNTALVAIENKLVANKYEIVDKTKSGNVYTFKTVSTVTGFEEDFKIDVSSDLTEVYKVVMTVAGTTSTEKLTLGTTTLANGAHTYYTDSTGITFTVAGTATGSGATGGADWTTDTLSATADGTVTVTLAP